jgi:hypothetical protein
MKGPLKPLEFLVGKWECDAVSPFAPGAMSETWRGEAALATKFLKVERVSRASGAVVHHTLDMICASKKGLCLYRFCADGSVACGTALKPRKGEPIVIHWRLEVGAIQGAPQSWEEALCEQGADTFQCSVSSDDEPPQMKTFRRVSQRQGL